MNILAVTDYLDLYLLGATGGRYAELVHNLHDSCCNGGNSALAYKATLENAAEALGGRINVMIDDTWYGHRISPSTAERIAAVATADSVDERK